MSPPVPRDTIQALLEKYLTDPADFGRFGTMVGSLRTLLPYLQPPALDFGAANGLSMLALTELGIADVWGVEPDGERVERGHRMLAEAGLEPERLLHLEDTRHMPYPDRHFATVLANAVLEHIPQPRDAYIRELWRVLRPGGTLVLAETPNKYFPLENHTTGLPFLHWLPSGVAHRVALRFGRNPDWYRTQEKWAGSGWRGLGWYELVKALPRGGWKAVHEMSRPRHRIFRALGLPSTLLDPYPLIVLRKV